MRFLFFIFLSFVISPFSVFSQELELYKEAVVMPDVSWEDSQDGLVHSKDLRGKVILLNFWATWCGPCKIEMPDLDFLQRRYGLAGLEVVTLSIEADDNMDKIHTFFQRAKLNSLKVTLDRNLLSGDKSVADIFRVKTIPTSYLIDRDGVIIAGKIGLVDWRSDATVSLINDQLRKKYDDLDR